MAKKKKADDKIDVHDDLTGFDIKIDSFGEMSFNYPIDRLNKFLNENTNDKKLNPTTEEE